MKKAYTYSSPIADDIRSFIAFRRALGYTVSPSQECVLSNLDRYCLENHPGEAVISRDMFTGWMRRREGERKNSSHNARLYVLNSLARYQRMLGRDAYADDGQMRLKAARYEPFIFTDEELSMLFRTADSLEPTVRNDTRHLVLPVMLRLIYCCGLRPDEVRNIRISDLDLRDRMILIHKPKNREDRKVRMSKDLAVIIASYIVTITAFQPRMEYLFENQYGGAYSADWLRSNFRSLIKAAGIKRHGDSDPRVYDLRHTYATNTIRRWLSEGRDVEASLPYLMAFMGHRKIAHTLYYVHTSPDTLISSGLLGWEDDYE